MQLVSAKGKHREAQLSDDQSTGAIIDPKLLLDLHERMIDFAETQHDEPPMIPSNPCKPALVAHGLDKVLEAMPYDRKTSLHNKPMPSMEQVVGLLDEEELAGGDTLDVRFKYDAQEEIFEKWNEGEDRRKDDVSDAADNLFRLLLGRKAFEANQDWTNNVMYPVANEHEKQAAAK